MGIVNCKSCYYSVNHNNNTWQEKKDDDIKKVIQEKEDHSQIEGAKGTDKTSTILNASKETSTKTDEIISTVNSSSIQSKRNKVPTITDIKKITELASCCYDYKILCSVNEVSMSLKKVLQNVSKSDTILFVIGPEGGFSNEEENILINNGFISTSLGSRVLRTETASTFVLSIINYIFMR